MEEDKINPCKVILEEETPPFDVEAYRADLQRRADTLWEMSASAGSLRGESRYQNKARGIEIAISLLP